MPLPYAHTLRGTRYAFDDLRTLLARASPFRSGDALAGLAAAALPNAWPHRWRLPTCRSPRSLPNR